MKKLSIRRTSIANKKQSQHRDIEHGSIESTSSDNNNNSNTDNGNSTSSSSGIDAFLHRLDNDVDLNNNNKNKKLNLLKKQKRSSLDRDNTTNRKDGGDITTTTNSNITSKITILIKRTILTLLITLLLYLCYDTFHQPPSKRILGSNRIHDFLLWVKVHPNKGAGAFIIVYGLCVIFLLPGTPLTLGGGYVYKVAYGSTGGVFMATFTSMAGSLFGSCSCFLLGRYIMRTQVRKWGRKYPLFDAVDIAVSDNGFKIMCLLYLTPILPLGPVSYLCGTTSMPLVKFAMAKIAALPLMMLYVFIGASTDTFFTTTTTTGDGDEHGGNNNNNDGATAGVVEGSDNAKKMHGVDEETHRKMVLFGLILSIISMSLVSHFVKKELYKVS